MFGGSGAPCRLWELAVFAWQPDAFVSFWYSQDHVFLGLRWVGDVSCVVLLQHAQIELLLAFTA